METTKSTQICPTPGCGNVCDVLVSTGHSKPENKGKLYLVCPKCNKFSWAGLTTNGEAPKVSPVSPPETYQDRQDSIITQHSQEMALRALEHLSVSVAKVTNPADFLALVQALTGYFKAEAMGQSELMGTYVTKITSYAPDEKNDTVTQEELNQAFGSA